MYINKITTLMKDRRVILSTLWIFALLNYIYADIFTLTFYSDPESVAMTAGAVTGFAFLMETAIAMVLLSRVLKFAVNRWANIIVGVIHTALVSWSLSGGMWTHPYYVFFAAIEITCTLFIIWYAWSWRKQEVQN